MVGSSPAIPRARSGGPSWTTAHELALRRCARLTGRLRLIAGAPWSGFDATAARAVVAIGESAPEPSLAASRRDAIASARTGAIALSKNQTGEPSVPGRLRSGTFACRGRCVYAATYNILLMGASYGSLLGLEAAVRRPFDPSRLPAGGSRSDQRRRLQSEAADTRPRRAGPARIAQAAGQGHRRTRHRRQPGRLRSRRPLHAGAAVSLRRACANCSTRSANRGCPACRS